ncbi:MAG: TolC family protein [Rickettsiales bacterium]|nr:TolC family protein [Rickettsiales bacterium]
MQQKIKQITISLLIATMSITAHAVTLEDALINTYKTNPELNAQRESLKASDEAIMQALSRWLPNITAKATKQYTKQKKIVTSTRATNNSTDGKTHSLTISQNLFRSGADIASIKTARFSIEAARANLDNKEQEVFLKATDAYMNTLATKEIFQITQTKEKDNARLLNGTRQRFKAGDASKTDVALAEAELSKAKSERATAQASYETSKANFQSTIGLSARNLTLPKNNLLLPKTIGETLNIAATKNPQVKSARNSADAGKQNINVEKGNVLPTVDLQHSISDDTKQGYATTRGLRNFTTTVELSMPLFQPSSWSKLRETKRKAAQAQNEMNATIKSTRSRATQAWATLQADKTSLKARQDEYKARKIAYDGAKASEKAGLISTLDIIQYQNDYFTAYINFIQAQSKYYVSLYTLKSIVGECTATGLKLNTQYYNPLKNYNSIKWQLIGAF